MTPRKEIASSLVLILFSLTFLIYTTRYPLDDWENPGPAVFPLILGGVLLFLAAWQLIRALLAPKTPDRLRGKGSTDHSREGIPSRQPGGGESLHPDRPARPIHPHDAMDRFFRLHLPARDPRQQAHGGEGLGAGPSSFPRGSASSAISSSRFGSSCPFRGASCFKGGLFTCPTKVSYPIC